MTDKQTEQQAQNEAAASQAASQSTDDKKEAAQSTNQAAEQQASQATESEQPDSDANDELHAQVKALQAKADDFEDKYLRAEAEVQNMNARFKKEQAQILKYDGQKLAKDILPVMDNLKRALEIEVDDESGQQLKKGIQMVHDHLDDALTNNGVTEIKALNEKFNPAIHQAVQSVKVEKGQKPDTVVKVLQAGYQLQDRVLRPAMVVVAQ